ncbi:hypothetical protein [Tengunoibacter tsumagoiensis]|uniref:Uncharacterized protein n=1 Tax=Tengunoibacter tsumagoiensis TaxID=2014871 RepID=A0A402A1X2_9CHLR|nr:hypothetical protein [Tengunoibacter tsumagoiensis]GCE13150.1 hypothetical protein KTT_30090 [Tengunoibacter tsumagoiensis]
MGYQAKLVGQDPLNYFLQHATGEQHLQIADVVLRTNKDPKEIFAHLIRVATNSKWSHSAILYLVSDPYRGYNNTFLVEAKTRGINLASWRNEVVPFEQFTVGIKRPILDWYKETPYEQSRRDPQDAEDAHGISYLRHVRGIAFDQINGLYDNKTVYELSALYAQRIARRHLSALPQVADAAGAIADFFRKWDEADDSIASMHQLICSGLVQYSFFEALRIRISNAMAIPEHREAAMSNLQNMERILFREDPDGILKRYIQQVQAGQLSIADKTPEDVLDLLKTATPADFNNSSHLQWRFVINKGAIWEILPAADSYQPENEEEAEVLEMLGPEHHPFKK